jgi:outer membrane protein assembly factor BamB
MRGRFPVLAGLLLGVILVITYNRAEAVITAKTPLDAIEGSAMYIVVGKVEKHFPDKPAMLVTITEDIKGKAPFRAMPINCKVADEKTFKANQIEPLLKRFGAELEIIFFINKAAAGRKNLITYGYTNGTWFQIIGTPTGEKDQFVFSLTSAEPYFRKSFQGTNDELRKILKDHAAGKGKLPPLDEKVQPGFGPEYVPQKKANAKSEPEALAKSKWLPSLMLQARTISSGGQLFGVVAAPIALGPLFLLAMLFPTVFGGALNSVTRVFRRLAALMTLITLVAIVLGVHGLIIWLARGVLRGSWWGDFSSLWLVMTIATLVCGLWAWRRQLDFLYSGAPDAAPKTELVMLGAMSAGSVLTAIIFWRLVGVLNWSDPNWIFTFVMALGLGVGTLYRLFHLAKGAPLFAAAPLSTEGVVLGVILLGCLAFAPRFFGGDLNAAGAAETGEQGKSDDKKIAVIKKWEFAVDVKGMFASSPLVDGDYVYGAYSETVTRVATVVKLDRKTGLKKWEFFGKNEDLIQMISTPCLADGKLYFGEGFHNDENCKVYCVDAETGKEGWRFATSGQTESSPAVANGKVYIGAGNDGVYCLDAKTGAKIWKFPPKDYNGRLLRFGGGMTVVGDRLYCGTGVDRNKKGNEDKGETAAFCLDAATGKLLWKADAPYPVWSTPIVKDGVAYVTTGNGDVSEDAEIPGGALLCLKADTGKEQWRVTVPNGIIESPAADAYRVYFGCRDGNLYCVNRADGKERWKRGLDSPIIGTPMLDTDAAGERTINVFATAVAGKVCCLAPLTGDIVWTYNLTAQKAYIATSPRLVVTPTGDGTRRQLYFGCGLGGGTLDASANRPVFYCLEDVH